LCLRNGRGSWPRWWGSSVRNSLEHHRARFGPTEYPFKSVARGLAALAVKHGFSAPRLGSLGRSEQVDLTEEEAAGLYAALERALFAGEPAEHLATEDDALDRDTVHRVSDVLGQPERKMLRCTPP
jgi:hypothetical protein